MTILKLFRVVALVVSIALAPVFTACSGQSSAQSVPGELPSVSSDVSQAPTPRASGKRRGHNTFIYVAIPNNQPNGSVSIVSSPCSIGCATSSTTPFTGLIYPKGVAFDGNGYTYIGYSDASGNGIIARAASTCKSSTCLQTVTSGPGVVTDFAVDNSGDVFYGEATGVTEVPAGCHSAFCTLLLGGKFPDSEFSIALDSSGDVYATQDGGISPAPPAGGVVKIPVGCFAQSCVQTVASGLWNPVAVAVDAAGDMAVIDENSTNFAANVLWFYPHPQGKIHFLRRQIGGGFSSLSNVHFGPSGDVWVSDVQHQSIDVVPQSCGSASCVSIFAGGAGGDFAVEPD